MSAFTTDGDYTIAQPHGGRRILNIIERDPTALILEQDYQQLLDNFVRLDLNTPHPDYPPFYLISESDIENVGAGIGQWTRRYASIPATLSDYETFGYTFPGFLGTLNPPYNQYYGQDPTGRDPLTKVVLSRIENKYFLVGPGQIYATVEDLAIAEGHSAQEFPLTTNSEARMYYLNDAANPGDPETIPNLTDYLAMKAAGTEIVAEDSDIKPWNGNIYRVSTRYIVAK